MNERIERLRSMLERTGIESLVCARPPNVLMATGYWPVVGNSLAIVTRQGRVGLLVPRDEQRLTGEAYSDEIRSFEAASLDKIARITDVVTHPLEELAKKLEVAAGPIGHDAGHCSVPATYAAGYHYGASLPDVMERAFTGTPLVDVSHSLAFLRGVLTSAELGKVSAACRIAASAYGQAAPIFRAGMSERQIAATLHDRIIGAADGPRSGAYTFCMSGPNSAESYAAYQLSTARKVEPGDTALVHCNSYVGGFWTDVTRTYSFGEPDRKKRAVYAAVLEAGAAALDAVRPGACASDVDAAAREVLSKAGFSAEFRHAAGHGVGFAAIDHNAFPRIHPKSDDVLETGMVFNIEPAAYFRGEFGIRQCNMVTVRASGGKLLTEFHARVEDLVLAAGGR